MKMRKALAGALFLCCGFICVISGCDNIAEDGEMREMLLELELPAWPPENASQENYPDLVRWEVTYFDGEKICTNKISAAETKIDLSEAQTEIVPIVVQPVTKHGKSELQFFMAAGCVYPFSQKVSWQDGWAASVAISAIEQAFADAPETLAENDEDETSGENPEVLLNVEKILAQFNWEKYIATIREKSVEDNNGKKVLYNPWINDCQKFGTYIKNLSNESSNSLSASKRYLFNAQDVIENVEFYKTNYDNKELWGKSDKIGSGQFISDEGDSYGQLRMTLSEDIKKLGAGKMPLAQFIPDQDTITKDETVFLRDKKPVYFCTDSAEIILLDRRSDKKINLAIIS